MVKSNIKFYLIDKLRIKNRNKNTFYLYSFMFIILLLLTFIHVYFRIDYGILNNLMIIALWFILFSIITNFLTFSVISNYRKKYKYSADHYDDFSISMSTLGFILKILYIIYLFFYVYNIDLRIFFTTLALFSVALAWLFKEYVDNLFDGLVIIFSEDFKIRDYIGVKDIKGKIMNTTLQNTELRTDVGDIVYIPNSMLLDEPVTNFSKAKIKTVTVNFEIDRKDYSKVKKLEEYLIKALTEEFDEVLNKELFYFRIGHISGNQTEITLEVPVENYSFRIEDKIQKFTSLKILDFLSK